MFSDFKIVKGGLNMYIRMPHFQMLIAGMISIFMIIPFSSTFAQNPLLPGMESLPSGDSSEKGSVWLVQPGPMKERTLKSALIAATMRAIQMEIKLQGTRLLAAKNNPENSENIPLLEQRIAELKEELARTGRMGPSDYVLPKKKQVRVVPTKPYDYGSVLELDNHNPSEPSYYIAGIQGDDFSLLEAGKRYTLILYLLRPCNVGAASPPSFYVFVMAPAEPGPGFQAPDELPPYIHF
jgi:hypothetical protein